MSMQHFCQQQTHNIEQLSHAAPASLNIPAGYYSDTAGSPRCSPCRGYYEYSAVGASQCETCECWEPSARMVLQSPQKLKLAHGHCHWHACQPIVSRNITVLSLRSITVLAVIDLFEALLTGAAALWHSLIHCWRHPLNVCI